MVIKKEYYVYILECNDDSYYIGKTVDLLKRLKEHNGEIAGGAKYTRSKRPVRLVYYEKYEDTSSALKREYFLKKLTKMQKKDLIISSNQGFER